MVQSFNNNINSFNVVNVQDTAADDRSNILAWLSPLDPKIRHQDIRDRRVGNVGEWLLQTGEFRSWYAGDRRGESDNAVLFCHGDPGVGKTYISSLVIDSLCDQAGGRNATIACFYFDFAAQKEQSSTSMLGAVLKQLVSGLEEIPEEILRIYYEQKRAIGRRGPRLSDIMKMLQATSSKERAFICIDALDECVAEHRVKLLDSLNDIIQKSPSTRIFVTGRPHIRPEIGRRLAGRVTSISIGPKRDEIIGYLRTRLAGDTIPDAMNSVLEADILRKIPEEISEIFLLVSMNIDAILRETTIYRRRQKLDAMTDGLGLGGVYGATLDRIKGQGGEKERLGMAALMWISHAERPLKADELCHALAVEIGSPNFNTDNVPSIGTLLACCQGLVAVEKKASTARLIHFTLQEYLRAHPDLFGTAQATMAETCLSYLNSRQVGVLSPYPSPGLQDASFLEYSSLYWGFHAKRDLSGYAKFLALKLFDDYGNHISTKILLNAQKPYFYTVNFDEPLLFSGLHCASVFGIVEIVACLLEVRGCDVNQEDCTGNTPLVWAAHNGHEGVIKVLLTRDDVNPNQPDRYGRTPLSCAAQNGHERVVKMLLERGDVNPKNLDDEGRTPLHYAACDGRTGVVKILLGRDDVNPNKPDCDGRTPLRCAAWNGQEGVVELLLGREDVNPDEPDNYGQTPLFGAAWGGHERVVKMLLERGGVEPDRPDNEGQTPLFGAACDGHAGVVKILLERGDINPDKPDRDRQTPLCSAAWNGQEGVVELLLGREDVKPDEPDNYGQTPLFGAASGGHAGVVEMLLGRGDVDPDEPDNYGQTPLFGAAWGGHEGVVRILLGCGGVSPDKPDEDGQTPLWCAAENGQEGVVKMLLGRNDVNPDKTNLDGQTPLCCAARNGQEGVVKLLLDERGVDPNKPDEHGRTPLWWAAKCGHAGVKALLQPPASTTL